ncbi:MAG TPA: serine hydrolase [Candidatus Saccharimonadales bacterium]|nr:serine hydrolase [Candidatus Saccharimonadales bacterium]
MEDDLAILRTAAGSLDGRAALIMLDGEGTELFTHEADTVVPAASVIKLPLIMTLFADAAEGRLSLDERCAVGARVDGSGVLRHLAGVADLTLRDLATLAIVVSDNTATNRLIERIGPDRVGERLREWGCTGTRLSRAMFDTEATRRGLDNHIVPREIAGLLLRLLRGDCGGRAASDAVLAVLERTQDEALLRRYLPAGARVAHKTGTLDAVRNDAGILFATRPIIAVGCVREAADIRNARSFLGLLGWIAYRSAGGAVEGLPPEWPATA